MTIHLDHLMVLRRIGETAGRTAWVPCSDTGIGPFAQVFVNEGFTLDFGTRPEPIPRIPYCFRVGQDEFDAIPERIKAAGIALRSAVHGRADGQIGSAHGGSIVYWNAPATNGKCSP